MGSVTQGNLVNIALFFLIFNLNEYILGDFSFAFIPFFLAFLLLVEYYDFFTILYMYVSKMQNV